MTAATFILMYKKPPNVAASNDALDFFKWAYEKGDKMAKDLDYIPMPDNVVELVEKMWEKDIQQKGADGPRRGASATRVPPAKCSEQA